MYLYKLNSHTINWYRTAAFPSVGRGRLIRTLKSKQMDGDLIRWMPRLLSDQTVQMEIEGSVMGRYLVNAGVSQGSPVSPIHSMMYTSRFITRVEERNLECVGLSFVDDVGRVATGCDVKGIIRKLEAFARKSIDWVQTWGL